MELEFRQALEFHRQGELTRAESLYRAILGRKSGDFDALHMLGVLKTQTGKCEEAVGLFEAALMQNPDSSDAYRNLGVAYEGLRRFDDAVAAYDKALAIDPRHADALYNRGNALRALGRQQEAIESYDRAVELAPNDADALSNRGNALRDLGRYDEALSSYDRAIALAPAGPEKHYNRACALQDLGWPDEAIAAYDRALALRPDYPECLLNKGTALEDVRRYDEALALYARVAAADPGNATAHWNEGLVRLLLGDFPNGWKKYEWRWKRPDFTSPKRAFRQPLWTGERPLRGKRILVHAEQGLGDTIQFCRYVDALTRDGAGVILEVQPELKSLITGLTGADVVIARGEAIPEVDLHCPLMSLPLALKLVPESIGTVETPYLKARADRVEEWSARLGQKRRPRIGVVWSGDLRNKKALNRSIALAKLRPLFELGDCEFVSVQKILSDEDRRQLAEIGVVREHSAELKDFSDTAALVSLLDLVISVDTAVAHLAGALGKPVWILLHHAADWRWFLDREDSPWYPSARLFRQTRAGDWSGVADKVLRALRAWFDGSAA
jgi:tetratricopeptide (TPR) repeat protein